MSFSGEVKEELVKQLASARHCQLAELAAILIYAGAIKEEGQRFVLAAQEESAYCLQKTAQLLQKLFETEIVPEDVWREEKHMQIEDAASIRKVLQAIKYQKQDMLVNPVLIKSLCCKRAFLRGVFLSVGSMSNPEKGYHLEFVCNTIKQAEQIQEVLQIFEVEAKIVQRKKYQVLYIKESEEIVEVLNIMGAHVSLMNLENLRILKDMRNSINRRVNCEAANITKTVNAATKQIEDIQFVREHYGFEKLSPQLREIAEVRLDYPEATLKELGEYLEPKVGKSGVNHRLRKLGELADKLRV